MTTTVVDQAKHKKERMMTSEKHTRYISEWSSASDH
jgi:hypothetical protein